MIGYVSRFRRRAGWFMRFGIPPNALLRISCAGHTGEDATNGGRDARIIDECAFMTHELRL